MLRHICSFSALGFYLASASLAHGEDSSSALQDRQPLGQSAYLKIDTSGSRTSGMVRSGELHRTVLGEDRSNPADLGFSVKNHCKVSILFMGTKEGEVVSHVSGTIFSAQFLEDLRAGQIYSTPELKIKHNGYKDARNMDGHQYLHADELYIYDIDTNSDAGGFGLSCLSNAMLAAAQVQAKARGEVVDLAQGIEDLKITVLLHHDAPVIGEAKLDMTGLYNGSSVKLGGDYIVQP